jgi:drug/metabolite transporter (DMT)-like permease
MPPIRTLILTISAMLAFAGNSLLCRMALKHTSINATSFTFFRLISGALLLWLIVRLRGKTNAKEGSWLAAIAAIRDFASQRKVSSRRTYGQEFCRTSVI